jgi:hypothetical protein
LALCWAGIACPEMLQIAVAQCRQNLDQQTAELRNQALADRYSPSQIRAYWQAKAHEEGIDNWARVVG